MSYVKRVEVKKTIVLEFTLPGVDPSWSSGAGGEKQLSQLHSEQWCLKINQDNALDTADVFAGIAKSIRETMGRP